MLKANIEAAIEAKQKEREENINNINHVSNLIERLNKQKSIWLDKDTDLYYEIEELKEQLND